MQVPMSHARRTISLDIILLSSSPEQLIIYNPCAALNSQALFAWQAPRLRKLNLIIGLLHFQNKIVNH